MGQSVMLNSTLSMIALRRNAEVVFLISVMVLSGISIIGMLWAGAATLALGLAVFALFWPQKTVGLLVVRRQLVRLVGAVLAVAGLILVMWPTTGVVTVSWLISVVALVFGCVLVFVATKLRRLSLHMSKT